MNLTSLPPERPGGTSDPPETLDVVPQGPAHVLPVRLRLPLQRAAQRVRHAGSHAAGDAVLRHLRTGVVSVPPWVQASKARVKGADQYAKTAGADRKGVR